MIDPLMDDVFVDRKEQGLATHRLTFLPSGEVRSDWFEWGYEEYRDVKANVGTYTTAGDLVRVTWPQKTTWMRRLLNRFTRQDPGPAVVDYRLHSDGAMTFLVREHSLPDLKRWLGEPHRDEQRLPVGTYVSLQASTPLPRQETE